MLMTPMLRNPTSLRVLSRVFFLFVSFFLACQAFADPVSNKQAKDVVQGWLAFDNQPMSMKPRETVGKVDAFKDAGGTVIYYVVSLKPRGFVIVSADGSIEPIIGFSEKGRYDPSPNNPLGALVTNDMKGRLAHAASMKIKAGKGLLQPEQERCLHNAKNKWALFTAVSKDAGKVQLGISDLDDIRVPMLVRTKWDQDNICSPSLACYNYYTPPYTHGSTSNYPCGCVATAMAQYMKYRQWPIIPVGTPSTYITVDGSMQFESFLGGDEAGGPYRWDLMVNEPHNECGTITVAQRKAIGALTHDAGVSVHMGYTSDLSTSDTILAEYALKEYFDYDNAVRGYNDPTGTGNLLNIGPGLDSMLIPNLDMWNPVILGIEGPGHAVVCDGYGYNAGTLYYHINLGWSGDDDAWYNLPTIDTTSYTFTSVYKCVYNIFKTETGEIISGRVLTVSGDPFWDRAVVAEKVGTGETFTGISSASGTYGIIVEPNSTYDVTIDNGYWKTQQVSVTSSVNGQPVSGNMFGVDFMPKAVRINPGTIWMTEGETAQFDVKLNQVPEGQIVVTVTGDSKIQINSPVSGALTFNTNNWDTWQTVTVFAKHDSDTGNSMGFHSLLDTNEWTCPFVSFWITDDDRVIETNVDTVDVPEGDTATFLVKLKGPPVNPITVTVARTGGDSDIIVQDGASLDFDDTDWDNYQQVTLSANEDTDQVDGSATISCSAANWETKDVTANEMDNDPDSDSDGLPDDWELSYFGDLSHGPDGDDDTGGGDGMTNYEEWVAGTDPTDNTSFLRVSAITPSQGFSSIVVEWSSVAGRIYVVWYSDEPYGDSMAWLMAEDGIPASGTGANIWEDDGSLTGNPPSEIPHRCYRIEVRAEE